MACRSGGCRAGRRAAEGPAAMPGGRGAQRTPALSPCHHTLPCSCKPLQPSASCRDVCIHQLLAGNGEGVCGRICASAAG